MLESLRCHVRKALMVVVANIVNVKVLNFFREFCELFRRDPREVRSAFMLPTQVMQKRCSFSGESSVFVGVVVVVL